MDLDLAGYSDDELLRLWKRIPEVLRERGVCRTRNVVSDVAERLVADKLGLTLAGNSTRSYDASDSCGLSYQIKARLHNEWNTSRQLGDIHCLTDERPFDYLIAVFFSDGFPAAQCGYKIPLSIVRRFVRKKGNRDVLLAQGQVLSAPGVEDITSRLR